jgi:hypothetical protein
MKRRREGRAYKVMKMTTMESSFMGTAMHKMVCNLKHLAFVAISM